MSSNDDMYERGSEDAVHDDLNPFYYQHYYNYRRGYNVARRQLHRQDTSAGSRPSGRIWLAGGFLAILCVVGLFLVFNVLIKQFSAERSLPVLIAARPTIDPGEFISATPTLPPLPSAIPVPILQIGGRARVVNVGESPLLARQEPGTSSPVQTRFALDTEVTILDGPVEVDGYTWWHVEAAEARGWSAERNLEGVVWLEPLP